MSKFIIKNNVKSKINHWIKKYPSDKKRSVIVPALLLVQRQNRGYLTKSAMDAVSDYLGLPRIIAYEISTFYDMFELHPIGKNKITICTNISCMLRGSDTIVKQLKRKLGINLGETTPDFQFTLRESECLAACGGAPVCQINDKDYIENLTPKKITDIVNLLSERKA